MILSTWKCCKKREERERRVQHCVPGVQEDELHVQTGPEHKHVTVQFDLSHGAGWQRVSHGHQTHVLVAALKRGHVQTVLTDLQVATAVDHLWEKQGDMRIRKMPLL